MQPIQQAFEPVSICFASDDNYAPHLKVAIYSLLCNRNRERSYDIIILHKRISREHQGEYAYRKSPFFNLLQIQP